MLQEYRAVIYFDPGGSGSGINDHATPTPHRPDILAGQIVRGYLANNEPRVIYEEWKSVSLADELAFGSSDMAHE